MALANHQFVPLAHPSIRHGLSALFAILVVHGVVAAVSLSYLPEIMPVHFDAEGRPDAWSRPTMGGWFMLWFVSAAIGAVMALSALLVFRVPPRLMSLPRKEEFLSLPAERRERILATLAFHVIVIGGTTMLTMLGIHTAVILVALEVIDLFPVVMVFTFLGLVMIETVVMFARLSTATRREIDEHVRREGP